MRLNGGYIADLDDSMFAFHMMHDHLHSKPKIRWTNDRDSAVRKKELEKSKHMAKWVIQEWATSLVEKMVDKESVVMASFRGGLHCLLSTRS